MFGSTWSRVSNNRGVSSRKAELFSIIGLRLSGWPTKPKMAVPPRGRGKGVGWRVGRLEGWRVGGLEGWKAGGLGVAVDTRAGVAVTEAASQAVRVRATKRKIILSFVGVERINRSVEILETRDEVFGGTLWEGHFISGRQPALSLSNGSAVFLQEYLRSAIFADNNALTGKLLLTATIGAFITFKL